MTNETCALRLHGYPAVHAGGNVAALPLKHGLALLAYLADHPHPVGRDALATLLWPDAPPGVARTRLRRLVHAVRHALELARAAHDRLIVQAAALALIRLEPHDALPLAA